MSRKKQLTAWLTGAGGQLGNSIIRNFGDAEGIKWLPTIRNVIDLTLPQEVERFFNFYKPDVVVNAAAFTGVDDAEINCKEAIRLNTELPIQLAELCRKQNRVLFHFSTDHVFGGEGSPERLHSYKEGDTPNPANFYAKSKLEGEEGVLANCPTAYIWRTAWLYSPYGKNFYNVIRKKALEGTPLTVVNDETGSPTSAIELARAVVRVIQLMKANEGIPFGLYHYSDMGEVTRYDFAKAILDLDPQTKNIEISPCTQKDYKTIAKRPSYSPLNTEKIQNLLPEIVKPWEEALREVYKIDNITI
ncbi:dTDP-4-dehydrorhamnose reductase [Porphyromonas sp.]|uniref:dTDP-4-dehydrorhamnose reductase n=1 Tax=Porphyromonas sp. TaxID=1924944 RepID=UPI0026DD94A3|nr:dTDP-4-dehydrorhamnose reductase [Porphyromonas sp.]MDO4695500.1 dTDP-4-dehydrorhamnose reductase [Porphyromonas sp.]MDO4770259.1 dTDP-4-dehydrorhamnose reductase [Porphyromonas sp.]